MSEDTETPLTVLINILLQSNSVHTSSASQSNKNLRAKSHLHATHHIGLPFTYTSQSPPIQATLTAAAVYEAGWYLSLTVDSPLDHSTNLQGRQNTHGAFKETLSVSHERPPVAEATTGESRAESKNVPGSPRKSFKDHEPQDNLTQFRPPRKAPLSADIPDVPRRP